MTQFLTWIKENARRFGYTLREIKPITHTKTTPKIIMNTNTEEQIHGHEVLRMMTERGHDFSRESLIQAIHERFGPRARFHICSGGGMDAAQLVDTLTAKGKFMGRPDAFQFNPATKCDH